jgi:cholesterol transport system auxiliary component
MIAAASFAAARKVPVRPRGPARLAATAAAALSLLTLPAGCGGLIPKPPERQIYRTEARFPSAMAAGFIALPRHPGVHLAIATPTASSGLDTDRIALARSPLSLDYYADAAWADDAPMLVRTALVEGFEKSAALASVGPAALGLYADFALETAIRDFEAVYDSRIGAAPRVVVALDLKLVHMPDRKIVAETLVRGEAPAAANAVPAIVGAFNTALGAAVENAIAWTLGAPPLSRPAR